MRMDWHQLWEIVAAPDNVPITALLFLIPFYAWYGLRQSLANDRLIEQLERDQTLAKAHHRTIFPYQSEWPEELPVWPYLLRIELLVAIVVTVILFVWSITINAPLEEPSNPNLTMNPAKAPWYFVGLQEMLVYFDPWLAGVVFPTLIILGLLAIPYLDTNPLGNGYYTYRQRRFCILAFCFGFFGLWVLMVVIGTFIRGPGWVWFWPGQTWDPNRVVFEFNRNLPELIGVASVAGKMVVGVVALGFYFAASAWGIRRLFVGNEFNRKLYARMTLLQTLAFEFFLATMLLLPVKMLLWHFARIKYILVTPWFNI
jgi:cytochrome b/b6/petD-like protein